MNLVHFDLQEKNLARTGLQLFGRSRRVTAFEVVSNGFTRNLAKKAREQGEIYHEEYVYGPCSEQNVRASTQNAESPTQKNSGLAKQYADGRRKEFRRGANASYRNRNTLPRNSRRRSFRGNRSWKRDGRSQYFVCGLGSQSARSCIVASIVTSGGRLYSFSFFEECNSVAHTRIMRVLVRKNKNMTSNKNEMEEQNYDYGVFVEVMGESPKNLVLEYFLEAKDLDHALGDVARDMNLNRSTVYQVVEELESKEVLVRTRKASGAQLYKFNPDSFVGGMLYEAYVSMLKRNASLLQVTI